MSSNFNYTEPQIVTTKNINKRSYIEFYLDDKRVRIGNGDTLCQRISPNRSKSIDERNKLLIKLQYELKKALEANNYPVKKKTGSQTTTLIPQKVNLHEPIAIKSLFEVTKTKLRSNLSKKYKRNLKAVYRQFKSFMTVDELNGNLNVISVKRLEMFLSQFNSTETYYMNKRRDLGVLFSAAGRSLDQVIDTVKATQRKRSKAKLHAAYEKEQLKPILNYLKVHYPKLYLCCLLTYASWLRPHEEIRLLVPENFKKNNTEIHLSGNENKGGKVRVVYVPDYVRTEVEKVLFGCERGINIFSRKSSPLNESYFNTQWSRAYKKMFTIGLIHPNQTIYSFRHTAAVDIYQRTKDVYLLQKLLGHSSILVTLKYLRSLGEFNSDELKEAAPRL